MLLSCFSLTTRTGCVGGDAIPFSEFVIPREEKAKYLKMCFIKILTISGHESSNLCIVNNKSFTIERN